MNAVDRNRSRAQHGDTDVLDGDVVTLRGLAIAWVVLGVASLPFLAVSTAHADHNEDVISATRTAAVEAHGTAEANNVAAIARHGAAEPTSTPRPLPTLAPTGTTTLAVPSPTPSATLTPLPTDTQSAVACIPPDTWQPVLDPDGNLTTRATDSDSQDVLWQDDQGDQLWASLDAFCPQADVPTATDEPATATPTLSLAATQVPPTAPPPAPAAPPAPPPRRVVVEVPVEVVVTATPADTEPPASPTSTETATSTPTATPTASPVPPTPTHPPTATSSPWPTATPWPTPRRTPTAAPTAPALATRTHPPPRLQRHCHRRRPPRSLPATLPCR